MNLKVRTALRRVFARLLCANKQRTGGGKTTTVAARKVVLDSLPSEHLCGCSPAPLSPRSPPAPSPLRTFAGGLSLVGHMLRLLRGWAGVGREGDVLGKLKVMR